MLFFYFSFLLQKATWSRILILLCDLPHNSRSGCFLALHCSITPCAQIASMLVTECSDGLLESYLIFLKDPSPTSTCLPSNPYFGCFAMWEDQFCLARGYHCHLKSNGNSGDFDGYIDMHTAAVSAQFFL